MVAATGGGVIACAGTGDNVSTMATGGGAQAHARSEASWLEMARHALLRAMLHVRQSESAGCDQRASSLRAAKQRSSWLKLGSAWTRAGTASALSVVT